MADEQEVSPVRGWSVLRAGGQEASDLRIPTKPLATAAPAGSVRIALGSEGEARLLLPLLDNEDCCGIVGAPALKISVMALEEHTRTRRFLDLTCLSRELEAVFAEVTDQIVERVKQGISCSDAARSTLDEFRALLTTATSSAPSRETVAGLIGELLFLNELLESSADGWKAWRGPEGARHDFVSGNMAVEVKVSMKKGKSTVTINGLEQLTEPAGGHLFLQHYELEAAEKGALGVGALAQAALRRASQPERVIALIALLGCHSINDPAWNSVAFRMEGDRLYEVRDGFPRLTGALLPSGAAPSGISAVSYCADLGVAETCLLDLETASDVKAMLLK